jgi:hypothetical protein
VCGVDDEIQCPACRTTVAFQRFHAGFGDQGSMYGSAGATVLTWSAFDPAYRALAEPLPWMLSKDEQRAVEAGVRTDLRGAPFRFVNPPLCPSCEQPLQALFDDSRAYFVVTGSRIDGDSVNIWA